jgi:hypothetical protein
MNRSERFAWIGSALLLGAILPNCHTTTLRSGRLPDHRPAVYVDGLEAAAFDKRWHHGFVNGIVEVAGNYNLDRICPNGWAEITTQTEFLNGLLRGATFGIYSPQSVTIRCAAAGMPEYPLGPLPAYLAPQGVPPTSPPPVPPPP